MRIAICASIYAATKVMEVKATLEKAGHQVTIPRNFDKFASGEMVIDKDMSSEEIAKHKIEGDFLRGYWEEIRRSNAILVVNSHKGVVYDYIGGNTLLEMGFASILGRIIFLFNSVPEISVFKEEILAKEPIVLDGDLAKIDEVKIIGTVYDLIRDAVFACEKVGLVVDDDARVFSRVLEHIDGVSRLLSPEVVRSIVYQASSLNRNNFAAIKRYITGARHEIENTLARCLELPKNWRDNEVEVVNLMTMIKERQTLCDDKKGLPHVFRLDYMEQIDILRAVENRLEQF